MASPKIGVRKKRPSLRAPTGAGLFFRTPIFGDQAMQNFRTFQLAVTFYRQARGLKLPGHLRDQLLRASSSIALNLAEGRGKATLKDQVRFFSIAMGSARESQAVLILADLEGSSIWLALDQVTASLYRLIQRAR